MSLQLSVRGDAIWRHCEGDNVELRAPAGFGDALSAQNHFTIVRHVAPAGTPRPSAHHDISMRLMAAASQRQHELDYDAEKAGVLDVTRDLSGAGGQLVQVPVDESGELPVLASRGAFDVSHLSCHGEIKKEDKGPSVPILLSEVLRCAGRADFLLSWVSEGYFQ